MDEKELFREALLLRRGPAGWTLLVVACALAVVGGTLAAGEASWGLVGVLLGVVLFTGTWLGGGETVVTATAVLHTVRPLPRARRVAVGDIASAEIVMADHQTSMFGGWEGSRGGVGGAVVESLEGPRQTGNRAVRLRLRSGEVVQFATWKPSKVIAAIKTAQESAQS